MMSNLIFRAMKEKIHLFNYFVKKVMLKEQELLNIKDDRIALLAIILSRVSIQHRHATGCSSETVYITYPKYVEELFLNLCIEAVKNGDNQLLHSFDFKATSMYLRERTFDDVEDKEISKYVNKVLYPEAHHTLDESLYGALVPADEKERINLFHARNVMGSPLELPEPCAETAMIDRAWEKLMQDESFIKLLAQCGKQNRFGYSLAHARYSQHIKLLVP